MQITVQSNDGQTTPVWITYFTKADCVEHNQAEGLRPEMDDTLYIPAEMDDTLYIPGFYWCVCSPGCIPDSDFYGPFSSESAAEEAANEQLNW